MEDAIALEVERQIDIIEDGGRIIQETRLYNGDTKESRSMRSKEEANDYRYFPCPDLLPVVLDDDYIDSIRQTLPELPDAKYDRFIEQYGLSSYDANILSGDAHMAQFFETAAKTSSDTKLTANWIIGELSARLNTEDLSINHSPVSAEQLAGMIARITDGTISSKMAKQVFEGMWNGKGDADSIIEAQGLKQVSDSGAIEALVDEVIASSDKQVENYRNADESKRPKMLGYFVGQIMKASKGQANPKQVNEVLLKKLNDLL
jgi:aspartyl-tRNA(Asn)/glutamyl-tRNA(Gln) amidotransferase subunit B